MSSQYSQKFYTSRQRRVQQSAKVVLSHLLSFVQVRSTIDLGCGTGTWLAELKRQGVEEIKGIDGNWVESSYLEIPEECFQHHNLDKEVFEADRQYDLAISIEVAEHLSVEMGDLLIDTLTKSSNLILFSAAVKGQGGTGHINEQPQHYWFGKFADRGFMCVDMIRPRIWESKDVSVIYKQNMLVYIEKHLYEELGLGLGHICDEYSIDRIHPDLLALRAGSGNFWTRYPLLKAGSSLIKKTLAR